jgi:hypothetical protein
MALASSSSWRPPAASSNPAPGRSLTLATWLTADRSPQPICSTSSTMIPSGPGRSRPIPVFIAFHLADELDAAGSPQLQVARLLIVFGNGWMTMPAVRRMP